VREGDDLLGTDGGGVAPRGKGGGGFARRGADVVAVGRREGGRRRGCSSRVRRPTVLLPTTIHVEEVLLGSLGPFDGLRKAENVSTA